MIRRPLRPTPLRRSTTRPRRYVKLRPFNPARRARLYARNFGEYADIIRSLPCAVPDCKRTDIEAAHVVHCRGMGGCNSHRRYLVPLCGSRLRPGHHQEEEGRAAAFEVKYGLDLAAIAAELWATHGEPRELVAVVAGSPADLQAGWDALAAGEREVPS